MNPRRLTIVITGVLATAVFVILAVTKWTAGEQIAGIVSAVCGVLAVGVAVIPLFSQPDVGRNRRGWRVSRTGSVRAGHGSTAITGVSSLADALPDSLDLSRTGKATVRDSSLAVTGLQTANADRDNADADAAPRAASGATASRRVRVNWDVQRSGQVHAGDHSTNVTGAVGSLIVARPADVPRPHHTKYLVRVRQLRPGALREREPELAELANFCTSADGSGYVWWQAGPWAGKTALMAHFVENPPHAVRIVSFFVIARDAAEADSEAFLELVIPQLAEIAELPVPANIAGNRKRDFFWELIEKADAACAARDERLVLLVDGLDEDRSLIGSGTTRSIASILPKQAGGSFRVIVSGRQNPPIPADVQADHPLRDPATIRRLDPSPHGLDIRAQAELQLRAHLDDGGLQHEVLAFVTVARGGLTATDLAELTDETVPHVRDVLNSHSGRAYQLRDQVWSTAQEVMLAHDKLREAAEEGITRTERDEKLTTLTRWAHGYRDRGWPADSPEYLLAGFYRVLLEANDVAELVAHVADLNRLELLRSATGGDAAGLGQVAAGINRIGKDRANVELTLRLALVRDHLSDRNGNLPEDVPEVWVRLGYPRRAEALAESSMDTGKQADALGRLVQPLIERGYGDRVGRVVEEACRAAILADVEEPWRSHRLNLAERLHLAGFHDEAVDLLQRICQSGHDQADIVARDLMELAAPDSAAELHPTVAELLALKLEPVDRSVAVDEITFARARRCDPRSSVDLVATAITEANSIVEVHDRLNALQRLAASAATAGDLTSAIDLLGQIVDLARALPSTWDQIDELDNAAILARDLNDFQAARSLVLEARNLIDTTTESASESQRQKALEWLAHRLVSVKDTEEALATAGRVTDPDQRYELLAEVAATLIQAGQIETSNKILRQLPSTIDTTNAHLALAQHHAAAGRFRAADAALVAITDPGRRARALGSIALCAIRHGDTERARTAAVEAENAARTIVPMHTAARVVRALGLARHQLGDSAGASTALTAALHEARRVTLASTPGDWGPMCRIAAALAETSQTERAQAVAEEVLTSATEGLPSGRFHPFELAEVIRELAPVGTSTLDRIAALLTTVLPEVRDVDSEWLAALASTAHHYVDAATAARVLDLAITRLMWSSTDEGRAESAIGIAETSMRLGLTEQAREHLGIAMAIADASFPGTRRSILRQALHDVGSYDDGDAYETILGHADPSDLEHLHLPLARTLGQLGRLDESRRRRDTLVGDARRASIEEFTSGLIDGGFTSEALAEYQLAEDNEMSTRLIPAAVRAHVTRGETIDAVRLISTTPMTASLRNALPNVLEHCNPNQARAVVSLALEHAPVARIVDNLADKLPQALVANGDMIHTIYQVEALSRS